MRAYQPEMSPQEKVDLSFQVETIMKDGMDLLEADKRTTSATWPASRYLSFAVWRQRFRGNTRCMRNTPWSS